MADLVGERLELRGDPESGGSVLMARGDPAEGATVPCLKRIISVHQLT